MTACILKKPDVLNGNKKIVSTLNTLEEAKGKLFTLRKKENITAWCGNKVYFNLIAYDDCDIHKWLDSNCENRKFYIYKDLDYSMKDAENDIQCKNHEIKITSNNITPLYELEICHDYKKYRVLKRYEEVK